MTRAREAARLIGNNTFRLDSNNAVGFNSTTPDAMFDINSGLTVAGVLTATSFSGTVTNATNVTVADESSDTTCFPLFVTAATGNLAPKSGSNLTFNSSTGTLESTNLTLTGDLTVQGTTTTIDTDLIGVDKVEVGANNSTVGLAVTQSGSGAIIAAYDGTSEVFRVADGGSVGVGSATPAATLDVHGGLRAISKAPSTPSTGTGLEIYYAAGSFNGTPSAYFISYDRDGSAYKPINSDASEHVFRISGTERLRIDSSGRLLCGPTSSSGLNAKLQVTGDAPAQFHRGVADASGSGITISKSRNTSYGSNTIVQDDDSIGAITFRGDDGTDYNSTAALIGCNVDGTPGSNDMPGRLVFSTTPDGSATPTERLRITAAGNVSIQNDSGKFTCGASDDLQIYHDGTHSRIVDSGTGDLVIASSRVHMLNAAQNAVMINAYDAGAVELYHNGTKKAETTADGVDFSGTGSIKVPVGTTGERPTGTAGDFRYNSTTGGFEGYTTEWGEIAGGGGGITTTASAPSANTIVYLDLGAAQYHELALSAGITTISCSNGTVGDSHVVVINQPSSGIATVGFDTYFEFPSGAAPAMSEGSSKVDMVSFVVKKAAGVGGTELLASAGINYQ